MYFSKLHSFPNGTFLFFHYWFCYLISASKKFSPLSELLAPEEFSAGATVNNYQGQFPFPKPQPHNPCIWGGSWGPRSRTAGLITPDASHWSLPTFCDLCARERGHLFWPQGRDKQNKICQAPWSPASQLRAGQTWAQMVENYVWIEEPTASSALPYRGPPSPSLLPLGQWTLPRVNQWLFSTLFICAIPGTRHDWRPRLRRADFL